MEKGRIQHFEGVGVGGVQTREETMVRKSENLPIVCTEFKEFEQFWGRGHDKSIEGLP